MERMARKEEKRKEKAVFKIKIRFCTEYLKKKGYNFFLK